MKLYDLIMITVIGIAIALVISRGLASLDHPSALWLWRDMLGLRV